ncbi:MAG: hypothetical protein JWM31_1381, partial [Solirubrobacterales bacterium]|nr:hypothetical protein [Solirubrobacterales bacterium]
RRVARRQAARNRRVSARRAAVRRRNALIRSGAKLCGRERGRTVCRTPRPLFCSKRKRDGRTICRAYARRR